MVSDEGVEFFVAKMVINEGVDSFVAKRFAQSVGDSVRCIGTEEAEENVVGEGSARGGHDIN